MTQLPANMRACAVGLQSAQSEANGGKQGKAAREVALLEAKVRRLLELLGTVLEDTKANVEKKLARTYEEMQAELNEADQVLVIARRENQPVPAAALQVMLQC